MNPGVTKTQKINIFNTQVLQSLFQLFEWAGPKAARKGWKKPKKLSPVDEESLLMVTTALQEFLTVLCTCRKNGIAFHDKSLGSGSHMNQLILTALDVLPKPWKKPETSELVLKILEQSPDIIKNCLTKWEPSFEPRESPAWVNAISFLIKIINSLQTDLILSSAAEVLSTQQLQNALKAILLSPSVLKHLTTAMDSNKSTLIKTHALQAITAIIDKLSELKNEQIKKNLKQAVRTLIPTALWICEMWKGSEGHDIISDFLLSLSKFEPTFLDNPRRVCKALIRNIDGKDSSVQSAVLQTISLMDPTFLSSDSEQFEEALLILLQLSWEERPAGGAISALSRMLLNTGLWDHSPRSLDCWLGAWVAVPEENTKPVAEVFVLAVKQAAVKNSNLLEEMFSFKEKKHFDGYLKDVLLHLGCVTVLPPGYEFLLDFDSLRPKKLKTSMISSEVERRFISWLQSGEKVDLSNLELTVFAWDRLFAFTLQFLKSWINDNKFKEGRQLIVQECLKTVFESIPESSRGLGKVLLSADPSSRTLYNKWVSQLFGDQLLVNQINIGEGGSFADWLYGVIDSLKLSCNVVPREYLEDLRNKFLPQVEEIIKAAHQEYVEKLKKTDIIPDTTKDDPLSQNFENWMLFLDPSLSELVPVFNQLCSQTDGHKLDFCGRVWLSSMIAIESKTLTKDLAASLIVHLCRMVVLPGVGGKYNAALRRLITKDPLLVSEIPKGNFDFLMNQMFNNLL